MSVLKPGAGRPHALDAVHPGEHRQEHGLLVGVRIVDVDPARVDAGVTSAAGGMCGEHRRVDAVPGHQFLRLRGERLGLGLEVGALGLRQQGADGAQRLARRPRPSADGRGTVPRLLLPQRDGGGTRTAMAPAPTSRAAMDGGDRRCVDRGRASRRAPNARRSTPWPPSTALRVGVEDAELGELVEPLVRCAGGCLVLPGVAGEVADDQAWCALGAACASRGVRGRRVASLLEEQVDAAAEAMVEFVVRCPSAERGRGARRRFPSSAGVVLVGDGERLVEDGEAFLDLVAACWCRAA